MRGLQKTVASGADIVLRNAAFPLQSEARRCKRCPRSRFFELPMKLFNVLGVMLLLVTGQATAQTWRFCASEDGYCRFSGEKQVAYGAGNQWAYKSGRNGIACNNRTFGDPAPGVRKTCRYLNEEVKLVRCAREGEFCDFYGTREVRYGADRRWVSGVFSNGVQCTNRIFGDPAPNVVKSCVYDDTGRGQRRERIRGDQQTEE